MGEGERVKRNEREGEEEKREGLDIKRSNKWLSTLILVLVTCTYVSNMT